MQDKQKVTLYLPPDLHRQLKIRAAVDAEAMSLLAERAIDFYLTHPDAVEQANGLGQTHQIHSCPACQTAVVLRNGEMTALGRQPTVLSESLELDKLDFDKLDLERVGVAMATDHSSRQDEEELVPC
jgi:hypothetical protein